ncbi:hypothetical protein [Levilactobacillus angrenensis]|nr:hypothetical protein [Levilactobacillus angrenensis]
MKKEEFQAEVLKELRNLNKTLKIIASNQERHVQIAIENSASKKNQ